MRYEWDLTAGIEAHIQPAIAYSAASFSDMVLINRARQDNYFLAGFSAGIRKENWSVDLYGENLTDERAVAQ